MLRSFQKKIGCYLFLFLMCYCKSAVAQDVGNFFGDIKTRIDAKDYLKLTGSLQLNFRWNQISGMAARTDPFSARLNTALLVDLLGVKGPFSAAFSDGNLSYNLPAYAFYGFSPSYKWIQLHLGDRSMDFSPYSLSGHNFKGVGIELRPGKFYFGAMAGRLKRARIVDAGAIQNIDPVYKRIGRGLKIGFDDGENELGAILFYASDDPNSITISDSSIVRPQENLVLELQGKKTIGSLFEVSFDLAHSALTRDKTAPILQNPSKGLNGDNFGLFKPHSSTAYNEAWNIELAFHPVFANFTLGIEHLGPSYQSLGRLSFLNDTENISLGTSTTLLDKKVNLSAKVGVQRNGLSSSTALKGVRFIGSLNVGMQINERLNTNLAISNLNYTMRQRVSTIPFVVLDSIIIVQSNLNTQLTTSYLMGRKMQSALSFAVAYQKANSITNDQIEIQNENTFYSGILSYTWNLEDKNWTFTSSCLTNFTNVGLAKIIIISPSVSARKTILDDQLNVDVSLAYSAIQTTTEQTNTVWEGRLGGQWKISKKHRLKCQFSYVNNEVESLGMELIPFTDFNAQLGYQFTF